MATETNQPIVCRSCGQSIHSVSELRAHEKAHGLAAVNAVLSAKTKHGATLGEHHAEIQNGQQHTSRFMRWIDKRYHLVMLAEMTLELILILLLVILAWK